MRLSTRTKAEATRERIVETASSLFRKHGYSGVSVGDVMAAVGLTVGGFYKHFSSKEALAAEACARSFLKAQKTWSTVLAGSSPDSAPALRNLAQWYLAETAKETTCPIVGLNHDAATIHNNLIVEAYKQGARLLLDTLLEASAGETSLDRSRDQVLLLFTALIGAKLLGRAAGNEPWVEEIQRVVLSQLK
ncbi:MULTISPECIES: TetR/AcrR family transcriptional regulator [unclassified Pseudomonas]|uniref:TetR/AcrR family transcriptional regulator n=1 Tax=unclassified Pseudomonas TaxID=196821 RepID=UPI000A1D6D73|nr:MULTISPECIES: TetR/AcrR family transcriptional regulator [unclassified Pseudomonas]